jgi:hypothetical protein
VECGRDADERAPAAARIHESNNRLRAAPTRRGRPIDPVVEERADRRRTVLERQQVFDRVREEAGERLPVLRGETRHRAT